MQRASLNSRGAEHELGWKLDFDLKWTNYVLGSSTNKRRSSKVRTSGNGQLPLDTFPRTLSSWTLSPRTDSAGKFPLQVSNRTLSPDNFPTTTVISINQSIFVYKLHTLLLIFPIPSSEWKAESPVGRVARIDPMSDVAQRGVHPPWDNEAFSYFRIFFIIF